MSLRLSTLCPGQLPHVSIFSLSQLRLTLFSFSHFYYLALIPKIPFAYSYCWKEELAWRSRIKMGLFLCMMHVQAVGPDLYFSLSNSYYMLILCQWLPAGFTEIVEVLINSTSNPEAVKRMLESVDVEGDTVSILWFIVLPSHFIKCLYIGPTLKPRLNSLSSLMFLLINTEYLFVIVHVFWKSVWCVYWTY